MSVFWSADNWSVRKIITWNIIEVNGTNEFMNKKKIGYTVCLKLNQTGGI